MENQVTMDRMEYDRLKEIEREATTLTKIIDNNEPLIIQARDRWGNYEGVSVYSGERKIQGFFDDYNKTMEGYKEEMDKLKKRYEEQEKFVQVVKAYFN